MVKALRHPAIALLLAACAQLALAAPPASGGARSMSSAVSVRSSGLAASAGFAHARMASRPGHAVQANATPATAKPPTPKTRPPELLQPPANRTPFTLSSRPLDLNCSLDRMSRGDCAQAVSVPIR